MKIRVLHYDAFTDRPGKGNPAGIVPNAGRFSDEQMLAAAAAVGFNETVFIMSSSVADMKLRYFTPGQEMDLCGHATVASLFMLDEHRRSGATGSCGSVCLKDVRTRSGSMEQQCL